MHHSQWVWSVHVRIFGLHSGSAPTATGAMAPALTYEPLARIGQNVRRDAPRRHAQTPQTGHSLLRYPASPAGFTYLAPDEFFAACQAELTQHSPLDTACIAPKVSVRWTLGISTPPAVADGAPRGPSRQRLCCHRLTARAALTPSVKARAERAGSRLGGLREES